MLFLLYHLKGREVARGPDTVLEKLPVGYNIHYSRAREAGTVDLPCSAFRYRYLLLGTGLSNMRLFVRFCLEKRDKLN